jgi:hypothetical protein
MEEWIQLDTNYTIEVSVTPNLQWNLDYDGVADYTNDGITAWDSSYSTRNDSFCLDFLDPLSYVRCDYTANRREMHITMNATPNQQSEHEDIILSGDTGSAEYGQVFGSASVKNQIEFSEGSYPLEHADIIGADGEQNANEPLNVTFIGFPDNDWSHGDRQYLEFFIEAEGGDPETGFMRWNWTIATPGGNVPTINITYPINNTNSIDTALDINYTIVDDGAYSCWYSNDTMSVNLSLGTTCSNITNVTWSLGQHNVTIWVNDSLDQLNSTSVTFNIFQYGTLNVTLSTPVDFFNITQGTTFEFNATVECTGGANAKCGTVEALARYNDSLATPDTAINTTVGGLPFFVVKDSISSNSIQVGFYTNSTSMQGAKSVFVLGNYAYVASNLDDSLTIIDISDETAPTQVGYLKNGTGSFSGSLNTASDVQVSGNYAYVASTNNDSLTIIDISDETAPNQVGYLTNSSSLDSINSIYVVGNLTYSSSSINHFLTIINTTNVTAPTQVGSLANSTSMQGARSIFVLGSYAYVAALSNDSLTIIDISDETAPNQVGYLTNSSSLNGATSVQVSIK